MGTHAVALMLAGLAAAPAGAAPPEDLGDAPAAFDFGDAGPARATLAGPRLGSDVTADAIDPETGASVNAGPTAKGDPGDDALSGFGPLRTGRLDTVTTTVALTRVSTSARVCGWVDFDLSESFTSAERACATAATGATSATLTWTGRPADVAVSYLRLRVGTTAAQVERPVGLSDTGEVEDYPVRFAATPPPPRPALTLTASATPSTVSAVGQVVTYRLTASNTGAAPLTDLAFVADGLPGLGRLSCGTLTSLDPGRSVACTATRKTTQADLDFGSVVNLARVSAEAPGGSTTDPTDDVVALDEATVGVTVRTGLKLTTLFKPASAKKGTTVTLTLTAQNTGNVPLSEVRVRSTLQGLSALTCKPKSGSSLAPGSKMVCTAKYTVSAADAKRGKVTAPATVRAEAPYGDPDDRADDVVAATTRTLSVKKPVAGTGASGSTTPHSSTGQRLADTGGTSIALLAGFGFLVASGVLLLLAGRRRRS
ncbi:MAG TPA: GEVED domain-containing protein [Propionibacteriaceae bacterium]